MVGLVILVVGGLYLAACIWVASFLSSRIQSAITKRVVASLVVAVLVIAPFFDGIRGYFVLQRLCETESRTRTFGHVEIPRRLFDDRMRPRFLDNNGNIDWTQLSGYAVLNKSRQENYGSVHGLNRDLTLIVRAADNAVIAERVSFNYGGGWIRGNTSGFGADSCIAQPSSDDALRQIMQVEK